MGEKWERQGELQRKSNGKDVNRLNIKIRENRVTKTRKIDDKNAYRTENKVTKTKENRIVGKVLSYCKAMLRY